MLRCFKNVMMFEWGGVALEQGCYEAGVFHVLLFAEWSCNFYFFVEPQGVVESPGISGVHLKFILGHVPHAFDG